MDASARFARRAYRLPATKNNQKVFAGDVFFAQNSVRLRDTLATIVAEPETHVGDRVKPEAREGLRRARALAEKNTRARHASESNLYPDPDMLRALDRAFGVALVKEDFCAEASALSHAHEDDAERKTNAKSDVKSDASSATRGVSSKASRAFFESTRAFEKRVKKHPRLTIENSAYLAGLARARVARAERDVQTEVHQATIGRLERTRGAARRDAWAEWNVRRAPRDAFESETETARRHATASIQGPSPPPTPGWGRTHAAPFTWPAATMLRRAACPWRSARRRAGWTSSRSRGRSRRASDDRRRASPARFPRWGAGPDQVARLWRGEAGRRCRSRNRSKRGNSGTRRVSERSTVT